MPAPDFAPRRLLLRVTGVFGLVFCASVIGNAFYTAAEQSGVLRGHAQSGALANTRLLAAAMPRPANGFDEALRPALSLIPELKSLTLLQADGKVLAALSRDGRGEWSTDKRPPRPLPEDPMRERGEIRTVDGQTVIVARAPLASANGDLWLSTETGLTAADRMFMHILVDSLLQGMFALLVGILTLWLLLRRPLAALQDCTTFAERLDSASGETLPTTTGSRETDRLAQALNRASLRLRSQQSALLGSEARTCAIIGAAIDAVITFDRFGTVIDYNPAARRLLGWTPEQAVRHPVIDLLVPASARNPGEHDLLRWLGQRFDNVIGHHLELELRDHEGRAFPAQLAISAANVSGHALYTAFLSDISERRSAQAQLMQARDAAEAADRAKSDFLANMSHEIRTPMAAITGMTALALDTDLTGEQREYLDLLRQSSDTLLALIDDILDFSRIESGHLTLETRPFSLREMVGGIVRALAPKPGSPVQLACHIDPAIADGLVGDPQRLRQVLVNLLSNALKFTSHGQVELAIRPHRVDAETQGLHFAVSDTGIGIPREKHGVIFEAFSQADNSTTRRFGGTGLGLAICTRLVARMGGTLGVTSRPGDGATFHFTLDFPRTALDTPATPAPHSLDTLDLLVIEPDDDARSHLGAQFAHWGLQPRMCADLDQGIGAIVSAETDARSFHALLIDASLARQSDWALIQTLAGECTTGLPVILLHDADMPVTGTRPASISATLARPVDARSLLDSLIVTTGAGPGSRHRGLLNILLAEDNPTNQTIAVRMLERLGHRVDVADNGLAAAELAARKRYDLILMDLQMPLMGGFEAMRRIREQDGTHHTPIVAMTAHAMAGDREHCLEAGMDDYISKPVQIPALLRALDGAMDAVQSAPGHAPGAPAARFDRGFLLRNLDGDEDLMGEIIRLYLRDYRDNVAALTEAFAHKQPDNMSIQAHTFKGMVSNFGALRLTGITAELERWTPHASSAESTGALLAELVAEADALAGELRSALAKEQNA
jgi:two-component system, sensor histidine kinase and response regulator